MKKKSILIGILAGLIMAAGIVYFDLTHYIFQTADAANPQPVNIHLSDKESIRILESMLTSHENWKTIQGKAFVTYYPEEGKPQVTQVDVLINAPDSLRIETTGSESETEDHFLQVSDDKYLYEVDFGHSLFTRLPHPRTFVEDDLKRLPTTLQTVYQNEFENIPVIYPHPLASSIASPIAELVFPTGLAQRRGELTVVEEAEIAGRSVWVIDWEKKDEFGQMTLKERLWIDKEMGIVLKIERYFWNEFREVVEEISFEEVTFNSPTTTNQFSFTVAKGLTEESVQEYFDLPENFGQRDSLTP